MTRRGHGELYRPSFEPIAQIGDVVALRTSDGFVTEDAGTPFYVVTHLEPTLLLGTKGIIGIWCATNSFGAPYQPDKLSIVGTNLGVSIAAGAVLTFQPDFLTLQKRQYMQFRTLIRSLPDSNAAYVPGVIDDYDLLMNIPTASTRFGTQKLGGVLNAQMQYALPADAVRAPAQGTNFPVTYTNPQGFDPFAGAARSEMFVYGNDSPNGQFGIKNNGSAAATTGGIGLQVSAFLANVFPLDAAGAMNQNFLGYDVEVPPGVNLADVIIIPVQSQTSPKTKGS